MGTLYLFWLILAAILFILEIVATGFILFWFGIGALAAMIVSFFTSNIIIQTTVFIVVSAVLAIFTRPILNKYIKTKEVYTNVYTILGKTATVTQNIKNELGVGQIKVDSDIWSARTEDNSEIENGMQVKVLRIDGVKAIVKKI